MNKKAFLKIKNYQFMFGTYDISFIFAPAFKALYKGKTRRGSSVG